MTKEKRIEKVENKVFNWIVLLLFISFFEESQFKILSFGALAAMLLLPIIILFRFLRNPRQLDTQEKYLIAFFSMLMGLQIVCIRWNALYTSLTQIFRSFASLTTVLYFRRFHLSNAKCKRIEVFTFVVFVLGIATIGLPNAIGQNILFGNYNTIGVLYFTLCIVNVLIYLKTRRFSALINCFGCIAMIFFSNTRTALFLLLIAAIIWLFLKRIGKKTIRYRMIFSFLILALIVFVWLYYNIKSLPCYAWLNNVSQKLFHKNFDSGRPDLWHMTVEAVGNSWLLGRGTGIDLENFYPYVKTPHSSFFDLYLQNGWLGVILFCLCIVYAIRAKGKCNYSVYNMFLIAIVFVMLFYNAVGIVFTKARSGIGLLQWAIIALPFETVRQESLTRRLKHDKFSCAYL